MSRFSPQLSDCILVNKRTMIGQQISLPRSYIVAYNPPGVRRYVKRSRQHVMLDIAKRQAVSSAARSNQDSAILIPAVQNHSPITVSDSSIRTAHAWDAPLVHHGAGTAPGQHQRGHGGAQMVLASFKTAQHTNPWITH